MAENQQQQKLDPKSPFSPLQSGCAFVMLANMVIYLGVVGFTLNLLDPSSLSVSYIAKRGFATPTEPEREEDLAFRQLTEKRKREQQETQAQDIRAASSLDQKKENSSAVKLSDLSARPLTSSRPEELEKPTASLTKGSVGVGGLSLQRGSQTRSSSGTGSASSRSAQSRVYSVSIFPQASLYQTYSLYRLPVIRTITPERYDPLQVEMAPSLDYPTFSLEMVEPSGAYIYTPPNPVNDPAQGGLRLSSPAVGAKSIYTNSTRKVKKTPAIKDKL